MNKHKVAVYGSLRKGLYNHRVLDGSEFIKETKTSFPANLRSFGPYPFVHTSNTEKASPISVEIYEVDDSGLQRLDHLEGYPNFYDRTQFEFEDGTTAWMYHIETESNEDYELVDSGDWVEYYTKAK